MKKSELFLISLPLIILLIGIIIYEIKTKLILDKVVIPAGIYFLIISCIYGSKPWWHYPSGIIGMLLIFLICAFIIEKMFNIGMGGGTIKLFAIIGAAVGIILALEVGLGFLILFLLTYIFAKYVLNIGTIPSSPLILISLLFVYIWNYGIKFFMPQ